jgi:hypothetical protein
MNPILPAKSVRVQPELGVEPGGVGEVYQFGNIVYTNIWTLEYLLLDPDYSREYRNQNDLRAHPIEAGDRESITMKITADRRSSSYDVCCKVCVRDEMLK